MSVLFNIDSILPYIERGALILTPNKRIAAKIKQAYGSMMNENGHSVWQPPRVYAEDLWFEQLWESAQDAGHGWACSAIITNIQRRQLFFQVVSKSSEELIMGVTQLVVHADSAYRDLQLWNMDIDDIPDSHTGAKSLSIWLSEFRTQLTNRNMITKEDAIKALSKAFKSNSFSQESEIALLGFDQISPLVQSACESATQNLHSVALTGQDSDIARTVSRTPEEEVIDAARWAKKVLSKNTDTSIGIIIPDLAQRKDAVERSFIEVFEPHYMLPTHGRYTLPFNFSAGSTLLNSPVINDALSLIGLNKGSWELDDICAILRSPFWGGDQSTIEVRSDLEVKLRNLVKPIIRWSDLRYHSKKVSDKLELDDDIGGRLDDLKTLVEITPSNMRPSMWVDFFIKSLTLMGWPGKRRPDSVEYQQITAWYEALESFSTLDAITPAFGHQKAVQHLRQILAGSTFQAKTANSPIQILGALEGASLQFTHCRVLGMARSTWPPTPSPNPLLPVHFQREHQMPRSDVVRELELALSITNSLSRSAGKVIFSHPEKRDGNDEHVSPLVADHPLEENTHDTDPDGLNYYVHVLEKNKNLSLVKDSKGPALEAEKAKGGSSILKEQSQCPFNAFAKFRLGAQSIEQPHPGLSHRDRGNLLHNALADIWEQWKDQATLLSLSDDEIYHIVDTAVDKALSKLFAIKPDVLAMRFRALEQRRLNKAILALVEIDKVRPSFKIASIEQSEEYEIGPLVIKVRQDRKDEVANGKQLLIDYKTSKSCSTKQWAGDRPEDPQLPLYAVAASETPVGVAFGACNAEITEYRGISDGEIAIDGIEEAGTNRYLDLPETWDSTVEWWKHQLEMIATEYFEGEARVSFSTGGAAHFSTDLLPLNRYQELETINEFIKGQ